MSVRIRNPGSRIFWICILVLSFAAAILSRLPRAVAADPDVVTLEPIRTVSLPLPATVSPKFFAASNAGLFVLAVGGGSEAQVAHADTDGNWLSTSSLGIVGASRTFSGFGVSEGGQIAVIQQHELSVWDPGGVLRIQRFVGMGVSELSFLGNRIIGFDQRNRRLVDLLSDTEVSSLGKDLSMPITFIGTTDGKIVVIEYGLARYRVLDDRGISLIAPVLLAAPEIQGEARQTLAPNAIEDIVYAAAVGSEGDIFCAISPWAPRTGVKILRFSNSGTLKQRIRCQSPSFQELRSEKNPDGTVSPTDIAVIRKNLILFSASERKVVFYPVE